MTLVYIAFGLIVAAALVYVIRRNRDRSSGTGSGGGSKFPPRRLD